ncbi:MAG: hypothetical protein ACOZBH_01350 [Patescibacteria group bacterium]
MLLTVHAATGVLIGQKTNNWWLAFIIAFIAHFIMDMIPHGDQNLIEEYRAKTKPKQIVQLILIDIGLCLAFNLFWLIKFHNNIISYLAIFMALAGSLLPDLLVGVHEVYPKLFRRFYQAHEFFHDIFKTKKISLSTGLMMQLAILILLFAFYNF